jgi:mannosyltransferase OCH1-like enzyme
MINNKIIQSFWVGNKLSTMELLSINSFLKNGHEFHLYTYDDFAVPDNCILKDANLIISQDKIFKDSRNGIASFADYFRIKLLKLKGGWWVDLDMICLQYFDFLEDYCFSSEMNNNRVQMPTNSCIKAPANSDFVNEYLDLIENYVNNNTFIQWGVFGPSLITEILNIYDSDGYIKKPEVFCPINWFEIEKLFEPDVEIPSNSYAIHLYNEMWRLKNIDKNRDYNKKSIYERLKRKYL